MYIFMDFLKNIIRYRNRYIINGLLLIILSYICAMVFLSSVTYKQTSLRIENGDLIKEMPDVNIALAKNVLLNRIYTFDATFVVSMFIVFFTVLIITALCLTERKYDIGVLLSMGMNRFRLLLLLLFEIVFFVMGSIVLGFIPACLTGMRLLLFIDEKLWEISTFVNINPVINLKNILYILLVTAFISAIPVIISLFFMFNRQIKVLINSK